MEIVNELLRLGGLGTLLMLVYLLYRRRLNVKVRVHTASFSGGQPTHYFINVVNENPEHPVVITHIWLEIDPAPRIQLHNAERPLEKKLEPFETWETWFPILDIPLDYRDHCHNRFRVRLSNRRVVDSTKSDDDDVPPSGVVPGGSSTSPTLSSR